MVRLAGQGLPQVSPCHLMSRSEIGTPIASSRQSSGPAGRPAMPGEAVHRHVSRPGLAQHRCTAASACQGELARGSAPAGRPGPELSRGRSVFAVKRPTRIQCAARPNQSGACVAAAGPVRSRDRIKVPTVPPG